MKEEPTDGTIRPFNYDVVDVSNGFVTRIPYKKKVKSSKLDSLLERRLKQHIIEERHRQRISASNPQTPKPISSASTLSLSTPARPRSPLKPHALAHTQLALGEAVKQEEEPSSAKSSRSEESGGPEAEVANGAELSRTPENVTPLVPSSAPASTAKDNCSTGTGDDSASPGSKIISMPHELEADLVERTTRPLETNSDILGQESVKLPDVKETTEEGICRSSEKQTGLETPNMKSDNSRTSSDVLDPKSSQDISPSKTTHQKTETLRSVHSGTGENGMGPVQNQEDMQSVGQGRTESDSALGPVSPLPQVNGNDGLGCDSIKSNSLSSNNGALPSSPQPKMNSIGKVGERGLVVSLKDAAQQKPLVNGDMDPMSDSSEAGSKESSLASKPEVDGKTVMPDQEYKPPVKILRVENNIETIGSDSQSTQQHNSTSPFQSVETKTSPAVKIIRMAPSPIPSAEESSMSDDFAEENCHSGTTEPLKTILTEVTTTSTTTTTTVVSTEMSIVKSPASGETTTSTVSTAESSAVSTLTTMTKTTVTKICSSGLDGQSEDSQSEMVTQEQKTEIAATISKSTSGPGGETTVLSVALSQEDVSSTKGRVRLLKFSRTKKLRSDTALPSYCKFVTKSNRKSIFVLQHDDLKVLGRRGGFREVPIFSYNAKPAWDIWPYPSPRPTFGITWR